MKTMTIALLLTATSAVYAEVKPVVDKSKVIICIGCHGADGNSDNPIYPKLAGQRAAYLAKQLHDFKTGSRQDEHMSSMVEAIAVSDIADITAFFSRQQRKVATLDEANDTLGEYIYRTGLKDKAVPACISCHAAVNRANNAIPFPLLKNQHADYLVKTLKDFRNGTRSNDPQGMMRKFASRLSDSDIAAVSTYIAKMK